MDSPDQRQGFRGKVYREKRSHRGVVFLRLDDERSSNKIAVIKRLLERFSEELADRFIVATDNQVRFSRD
ncbi:MAG TPA: hypothetical protein VLQ45_29305 [Thermoanaerobaculia bacterium]|nr:hypothetical protein [Thermoanaerobaculia bacterium]